MADKLFIGGITNTTIVQEDGKTYVHDVVDAEPALNRVKELSRLNHEHLVRRDEFYEEANIPFTVFQEWCREAGVTDMFGQEAMAIYQKKMQDPYFKKAFMVEYSSPFYVSKQ